MSKVPSLPYTEIVKALERAGWAATRQRGSHIRLEKHAEEGRRLLTVPAHRPVKRSTLSHILKQAGLSVEEFLTCCSRVSAVPNQGADACACFSNQRMPS
jgi:predicted RNA binding protein YcfA (HicA-like mRNA interferase family)